ncbi:MAG: hypothetical protein AAF721_16345, partial [Myxococcota bacterium]
DHGLATVVATTGRARGTFRAGAYVHEWQRFVPLDPRVKGAQGGIADLEHGRVAIATYDSDCQSHLCAVHNVRVRVFEALKPAPAVEVTGGGVGGFELQLDAKGPRLRWLDCQFMNCVGPWRRPTADANKRDPEQSAVFAPTLSFTYGGAKYLPPTPRGLRVRQGRLRREGADAIKLGARHRVKGDDGSALPVVVVDATGSYAAVLTTAISCLDRHLYSHAASVVDLATGEVHELPAPNRDEAAALDLGRDGALYMQSGTELLRWSSIEAAMSEAPTVLPRGVLLFAPLTDESECENAG